MIKAVCFDFFNTLSYYHPSREEIYEKTCAGLGIVVKPKNISKSLLKADVYWRNKNRDKQYQKRNKISQFMLFTDYVLRVINGSGVKINWFQAARIVSKLIKIKWDFAVFDDAVPTMKALRDKGFLVGIISNVDKNYDDVYRSLGLADHIDFNVTSLEAGCEKPDPGIFKLALKKAGVKADEVLFIGDQYTVDIVGARNAGIRAILIDRNNWQEDIKDCPRIQTLDQIEQYL